MHTLEVRHNLLSAIDAFWTRLLVRKVLCQVFHGARSYPLVNHGEVKETRHEDLLVLFDAPSWNVNGKNKSS